MKIEVINTRDGSKSLFLPDLNETYHSKFGARTESEHVYIGAGYHFIKQSAINILEVGFGTGLNVFLTYLEHQKNNRKIYYESLEKYPLSLDIIEQLNSFDSGAEKIIFERIHHAAWDENVILNDNFVLCKRKVDLIDYQPVNKFDLIYFDAFAPDKQPEMWTFEVFKKLYNSMSEKGILVTYSAKGKVRRTMQAAGFEVNRVAGPPGKREMIRAVKSETIS